MTETIQDNTKHDWGNKVYEKLKRYEDILIQIVLWKL